jgi:uncharacterized PurR-regulated membrane protein YhhQ (DUF165 family)
LLASVVAANLLTSRLGLVPAGFGLLVTAGTYAAGLSLALRDLLHREGGPRWVLAAVAAGVVLSAVFGSGRIALASAVAFGFGELADTAVYLPLRRRGWRRAVAGSNAVGAVVDTVLFLTIAGLPVTAATVGGQVLVKALWVTALALIAGEVAVRALRRQPVNAGHP